MSTTTDDHYREAIKYIRTYGERVHRRGMWTEEYDGMTLHFDMNEPIVTIPERKLSYRLLFAEALWILRGECRLDALSKIRPRYEEFSDDGFYLSGAYGPMFVSQRRYVFETLMEDVGSRQAVMTFWRQNPRKSRDIPCTVSLQFLVKWIAGIPRLDLIVFMRSSDAFLGLPYDIFSFSMMATHLWLSLACSHNYPTMRLGMLTIMIGSFHLYERDLPAVKEFVDSQSTRQYQPIVTHDQFTPDDLELRLESLRDNPKSLWI